MALSVVKSGIGAALAPPGDLRSLMTDEIFAQATSDQALSFFAAVGARLAASRPLPLDEPLPQLEQAMNDVWQELGLGDATLTLESDGIVVDHQGYAAGPDQSPVWPRAVAALLRGTYDAWFQTIAGPPLHTRAVRQTSERIILHHGL